MRFLPVLFKKIVLAAFSISESEKLSLANIKDSKGKEYSSTVLFGSYPRLYAAIVCQRYNIPEYDPDLAKYVKIHIDDGLEKIHQVVKSNPNLVLLDWVMGKIETGLASLEGRP